MKMVIKSETDLTNVLIITTDECGLHTQTALAESNDFDFDLDFSLRQKKSKSFIRHTKSLCNEHRNKSVPHNLQV